MAISRITYDTAYMRPVFAAESEEGQRQVLADALGPVKERLMADWKQGKVGFFSIPERRDELAAVRAAARDVARKFTDLIVVGIGGSDLGARAILAALAPKPVRGKSVAVHFIGANTDPEEIAALLARVDLRKAAVNVISKSGDTIETMTTFLLLRDKLIKAVGKQRYAAHVIATTDAEFGTLREIASKEGYRTLPVPREIGGRFSALTAVGLFPVACAGIDPSKLLAGCKEEFAAFAAAAPERSAPLVFAALHHAGYADRRNVTVLMPYAQSLREFAFWFRQLWAESLGKDGKGLTPVAAIGATDQHSQIQLYHDGPHDKIVTFIEVEKFRSDFRVPSAFPKLPVIVAMGGHKFSDMIHAEREATARALHQANRPNGTLRVAKVTPESVGALMAFFMLATAAAAELLGVNAYDQPGVEGGKRALREILARSA